jgi:hypothetical protein
MITFNTDYPAEAKDAYWQKKKSVLDKIAKASRVTGLGVALNAAEEKYNLINFDLLGEGSAKGKGGNPEQFNTPDEFDDAKRKAEQHLLRVVRPAREAMRLAATEADAIVKNEKKLFNATTVAAATAVAKALRARETLLKDIALNDFDTAKQKKALIAQRTLESMRNNLESALEFGDAFINRVKETPTPAVFNTDIEKASRRLYQQIGNVTKIKSQGANLQKDQPDKIVEKLKPWANDGERLPPNADRAAVLKALGKYEKYVLAIRAWWA